MVNDAAGVAAAFVSLPEELTAVALVEQAAASAVEQHEQEQAAQLLAAQVQAQAQQLAAAQAAVAAAASQHHPQPHHPQPHQPQPQPHQPQAPTQHNGGEKKRKGGRQKDAVWQETTIVDGKEVVCNKCHTVIHRYGCTKVERVRAHFENKCVFTKRAKVHHDADTNGATATAAGGAGAGTDVVVVAEPHTEGKAARYRSEYANKMGMFKRRIAQWIYTSAHPFGEVKNGFLRNAFRTLRPDITLPTQYELENDLLDLESNASFAKVNRSLSGKACCLTLESWVDINGQTMTNFVAFSEGSPFFLETAPALGNEKEFSVEEIERVLSKQKKAMTYGILTPLSDAVSKASREKIQKKYPHCVFYYGCVANALRLLMTDMCTILPWLGAIHDSILQMTTVFQHNTKLGNLLRSMQHAESKPPLVVPDDAAGATICDALDSVLKSERELVALVSRRDFVEMGKTPEEQETLKRVQNFVLGDTFLQDVLNALNILHPLQQQLTRVQTERVAVSYVYHCFLELLGFYVQMEHVNKKDKALITSCVNERFNSIYGDCHGIAYLLDPVFLGANMDEGKKQEIEAFVVACCSHVLHATGIDVLDQLEKYRLMVQQLKECNQAYWELLATGKVRPFDFWVERRQFPQLQQLAWIVFALPVASTIPGQTFAPSCALIHSRFHSQLPVDKLQKLTHVFCNAKFQQPEIKEPEPLLSIVLHDSEDPSSTLV